MNLSKLTVNRMIGLTRAWLDEQKFVERLLSGGAVGLSLLEQLQQAHTGLIALDRRRRDDQAQLDALMDLATDLDALRDRKARSIQHHFDGLIEGSDDEDEIARYRELHARLWPTGLRVIRASYLDEGGASRALDELIEAEVWSELNALPVGPTTLGELFVDWIAAGMELSQVTSKRAELREALERDQGEPDPDIIAKARSRWLDAVDGLRWALDSRSELAGLIEPVEAALAKAVAVTQAPRRLPQAQHY